MLAVLVAVLVVVAAGWWLFVRPTSLRVPASPAEMSWTRVTDPDLGRGLIRDVVGFGKDVVAVGGSLPGPSSVGATAAVWVSPDGSDWEQVADSSSFLGGSGTLLSVAHYGPDLIATSTNDVNPLWSSPDGRTWMPLEYHEAPYAGSSQQVMVSAASFRSGVVIGGGERAGGSNADLDAAVWFSPNARTAPYRIPRSEAVFGGEGDQMITDLAEFDGGIVAVGSDALPEGAADAAVWFSADGTTWRRVEVDSFGGSREQSMSAVTSFPGGLVAVGSAVNIADLDAAVWYSPDGQTWSRIDDPAVFGGTGHQVMLDVTSYGRGLVAVGYDSPTGGTGDAMPVVWYSPDGRTWMRSPAGQAGLNDPGSIMFTAMAQGSRLVAGGTHMAEGPSEAMAWVGAYVGK